MLFCGRCGTRLRHSTDNVHAADEAERRQLTVLFCDIVGSTQHAASMDPEEWSAVLRAYHQACEEIMEPMRGHVAQLLGDGVLVYFGYPSALEDAPRCAVRAALALVRKLPAQPVRIALPRRTPRAVHLDVRVGVHTGEVVVDRFGASNPQRLAVGDTLNLASRIQSATQPNTVAISVATQQLTAGFFATRELGAVALAGFAQPVPLFQVISETAARNRLDVAARASGLTPFVNRVAEMGTLRGLWKRAASGEGPVVMLSGDAGVGKSRHVEVLKRNLQTELAGSIDCQCSPYFQNTALYPLLEAIERHAGVDRSESAEQSHARLERTLGHKRAVSRESVSLMASLLSLPLTRDGHVPDLPPQRLRQQAFELIARFIEDQRPALWIVEDLHWADASTLEFLSFYLERASEPGILAVLTHRPEFQCSWRSTRLEHLFIDRLPRAETEEVVRLVAGARQLPPKLLPQLLSKADGNPLFAEEVTKAVLEDTEQKDTTGTLREIPASVRDPLMARVDGLGASKPLAQLAATLGREVSFRLLSRVANLNESLLRADLQQLLDTGLILPLHGASDEAYVWKHALLRDAAYHSLLESTRQRHHQRIAHVLVTEFPEIATGKPELLAQHFERAGNAAEAIRLWSTVGQRAVSRCAFAEATVAFNHALEQLRWLPENKQRDLLEIDLRAGLGLSLLSSEGFSSQTVASNYGRARELCARYGDVPVRVLYGVWVYQFVRGDLAATTALADTFSRRLTDGSDPSEELLMCSCLVVRNFWLGRFRDAREHCVRAQRVVDSWDDARAESVRLMSEYAYEGPLYPLINLAWCELYAGKVAASQRAIKRALELAERIDQPYVTAMVYAYACAIAHDKRDAQDALKHAQHAVAIAAEHQYPFWLAAGLFASGAALCELGREDEGLATLEQGLLLYKQMGVLVSLPYYTSYLVERYLAAGRTSEGLAIVQEMLELSEINVGRGYIPELLRLRGELLLRRHDEDAARASLEQALVAAQTQGTALFEMRSALSLMRVHPGEHARAALERACRAFDADAELSELQAARALLLPP